MPLILIIVAGSVGTLFLLVLVALHFYVVVKPNQAHVIVSAQGRKVYSPSTIKIDGEKRTYPTAYFFIPFIMQRIIVSLENVKHEINEVELRDINVAPFKCDITCWFKIANPDLAAEKLDVDEDGNIMDSIKDTLKASVMGITRAAAMGQEVIELMRDRKTFGEKVFKEVNGDLDEWGVQLVKLEIIDFSDAPNSKVIEDYESRREAEISSETRQLVAEKEQEASVKEAEAKKISEKARLDSEQEIEMRDVQKLESVGTRKEAAKLKISEQAEKANAKQVEADKTKIVGEARYKADAQVIDAEGKSKSQAKLAEGTKAATVTIATGQADAVKLDADAQAESTQKKGTAEAEVVRQKGLAIAEALEKKADAQKQFQDASKDIEMAKIAADIQKVQYTEMSKALAAADIQIVTDDIKFMGFGVKDGAGLGMLVDALQKKSGVNIKEVVKSIVDVVKPTPTKG